ncbi:hypothetical protein B932_3406 [Gluconobacter oxydans H24]|nr:hypothetical protein B932_3406 [Gluconobacter oxydans H24]
MELFKYTAFQNPEWDWNTGNANGHTQARPVLHGEEQPATFLPACEESC